MAQVLWVEPRSTTSLWNHKRKAHLQYVLAVPDFYVMFEVDCDASGVGIRAILAQYNRPLAYLSEKLSDAKRKYSSTYDKEFCAIINPHYPLKILPYY